MCEKKISTKAKIEKRAAQFQPEEARAFPGLMTGVVLVRPLILHDDGEDEKIYDEDV